MADTRDVLIRVRLEAQKTGDLKKSVEAAVVEPMRQAQAAVGDVAKKMAEAARSTEGAVMSRAGAQRQAKLREQIENDHIARMMAKKKKTAAEEIEIARLTGEKEARIEEGQRRLRQIRMAERLAAFKRNKAEELRVTQETEAKKAASEQRAARRGGFFSRTENRFAAVAGAVMAVPTLSSNILENLTTLINTLKGREDIRESRLYQAGEKFWQAVGLFRNTVEKPPPGIFRDGEAVKTIGQAQEEALGGSVDKQRELNNILLDRTKAERQLLQAEQDRIDKAREEFGLMTQPEQQAILGIAQKIQQGGIQSLTGPELEEARKFGGFTGLISEQAKAAAGQAGFGDVLRATGAADRIAALKGTIATEVRNTLNVDLDPARLADALEERIAPQMRQLQEIILERVKGEIQKSEAQARNAQGAAF